MRAQLDGHEGLDALLELFVWSEGEFRFELAEVSGEALDELFAIQMEGCRLADDWARLSAAHLEVRQHGVLPEALETVLDTGADLRTALREAGELWSSCAATITAALEAGALVRTSASAHPPAPHSDGPSIDELVEMGRKALRERAFDDAVSAFERALKLRPDDAVVAQNLRRTLQVRERWSAS